MVLDTVDLLDLRLRFRVALDSVEAVACFVDFFTESGLGPLILRLLCIGCVDEASSSNPNGCKILFLMMAASVDESLRLNSSCCEIIAMVSAVGPSKRGKVLSKYTNGVPGLALANALRS